MSTKRYDLEQQEQIARMSIEGGKSGNQIAAELGINKNSVYKWRGRDESARAKAEAELLRVKGYTRNLGRAMAQDV